MGRVGAQIRAAGLAPCQNSPRRSEKALGQTGAVFEIEELFHGPTLEAFASSFKVHAP
jgi:hypothetical protein